MYILLAECFCGQLSCLNKITKREHFSHSSSTSFLTEVSSECHGNALNYKDCWSRWKSWVLLRYLLPTKMKNSLKKQLLCHAQGLFVTSLFFWVWPIQTRCWVTSKQILWTAITLVALMNYVAPVIGDDQAAVEELWM